MARVGARCVVVGCSLVARTVLVSFTAEERHEEACPGRHPGDLPVVRARRARAAGRWPLRPTPLTALSGGVTGLGGTPLDGVTVEARTYAPDGSVLPSSARPRRAPTVTTRSAWCEVPTRWRSGHLILLLPSTSSTSGSCRTRRSTWPSSRPAASRARRRPWWPADDDHRPLRAVGSGYADALNLAGRSSPRPRTRAPRSIRARTTSASTPGGLRSGVTVFGATLEPTPATPVRWYLARPPRARRQPVPERLDRRRAPPDEWPAARRGRGAGVG